MSPGAICPPTAQERSRGSPFGGMVTHMTTEPRDGVQESDPDVVGPEPIPGSQSPTSGTAFRTPVPVVELSGTAVGDGADEPESQPGDGQPVAAAPADHSLTTARQIDKTRRALGEITELAGTTRRCASSSSTGGRCSLSAPILATALRNVVRAIAPDGALLTIVPVATNDHHAARSAACAARSTSPHRTASTWCCCCWAAWSSRLSIWADAMPAIAAATFRWD